MQHLLFFFKAISKYLRNIKQDSRWNICFLSIWRDSIPIQCFLQGLDKITQHSSVCSVLSGSCPVWGCKSYSQRENKCKASCISAASHGVLSPSMVFYICTHLKCVSLNRIICNFFLKAALCALDQRQSGTRKFPRRLWGVVAYIYIHRISRPITTCTLHYMNDLTSPLETLCHPLCTHVTDLPASSSYLCLIAGPLGWPHLALFFFFLTTHPK